MKHKSILSLLIFLLGFGATTTSCEDMLTPDMDRYAENFSGTDTVYFYLGIVRNLQDMVEQNELLGDMRSDLVATTEYSSDSVANVINYKHDADGENKLLNRSAYYKVINQCNFYLAKVDTNAVKNNIYYMRKEYAQVVAIRAWTYLQLVQTYGRVPFITRPVDNANTGWETNPEAWATADNLVDLLKDDLEKAKTFQHIYGSPNYGDYQTGNVSVASSYVCFQTDLVLGDLYLLRGKDRSDYVEAAKNYYYTLKEVMGRGKKAFVTTDKAATFRKSTHGDKDNYSPNVSRFISNGLSATELQPLENITVIPSAANSSFGRTLTRVQQIYGFDPHSTTSTNTEDTSDGQQTTQSGQISLELNYRSRQIAPSESYLNLCGSQIYAQTEVQSNEFKKIDYYEGVGDARMHATCPFFQTKDNGKARFITKYATISNVQQNGETFSNPQFRYFHSIYRLKQVYLRYAEALNRAGYPRHAFMILRDGINIDKMPALNDSISYDDDNHTKQLVYYLDSAKYYNAADYVGVDELRRAQAEPEYANFMDFSSNMWANDGIHEQGCGVTSKYDTLFCYDVTVAQRIEDEARRAGALTPEVAAKVRALRASVRADEAGEEGGEGGEGEVPAGPNRDEYTELETAAPLEADPLEINAVETLIADECALETAFEGNRMFDLIRFARHKDYDTSGKFNTNYGTTWLAWKIARRAQKLAPYENPAQYDGGLYSTLLNAENWYIANPVY